MHHRKSFPPLFLWLELCVLKFSFKWKLKLYIKSRGISIEYITPPHPCHLALKYQYMANFASCISCPLLPAPRPHWIVLKKNPRYIGIHVSFTSKTEKVFKKFFIKHIYVYIMYIFQMHKCSQGFLGGSVVRNPADNAGDTGWIPGLGRVRRGS